MEFLRSILNVVQAFWRRWRFRYFLAHAYLSYFRSLLRRPNQVIHTWSAGRPLGRKVAVFVHYDAAGEVQPYLLPYLQALHERGFDTVFDGEVTGLIPAGAFLAFGDLGADGMLPVRRMRGDWYELNEEGTVLRGEEHGGTVRLGDPMQVRVRRVDVPRGRVDLEQADGGAPRRR